MSDSDLIAEPNEGGERLADTQGPVPSGEPPRRLASPGRRGSAHDAASHQWVVRTADSDKVPTTTRLRNAWPLLRMYAVRQVRLRYTQSALGLAWTVVQPVMLMAIYGFIFTAFFDVDGDGRPYLAVAWTGLTVWMFVQAGVQAGTVALRNDAWLLGRVWFPREIIPLAPVLASLIDFAAAGIILLGVIYVQGVGFGIQSLAVVAPAAVAVLWVAAISVITATITVFLRDMATIVALGLRLTFIASPIMYPASRVPPEFKWVNAANPFAVIIENFRATLLAHHWPNWGLLAFHGAVAAVLLVAGMWYLRSVERRMVDVI